MKKYKVSFQEILNRNIEIESDNEEEAKEKAKEMYDNEKIILDWDDLVCTDIEILEEVEDE